MTNNEQQQKQQQQRKKSSLLKLAGCVISAIFVSEVGHKGSEANQRKKAIDASMKENNRDY